MKKKEVRVVKMLRVLKALARSLNASFLISVQSEVLP
jgi:hypothetical protein